MGKESLIYIKDYQALNCLVAGKPRDMPSYIKQLPSMIGKPITVFVDGAGKNSFTGILTEVFADSIKIITALPSPPVNGGCTGRKKKSCRFGACTTIMLDHITAITVNYV